MKFAARDRGTARTLIRTTPGSVSSDTMRSRYATIAQRGDAPYASVTQFSRDGHGDGHAPATREHQRPAPAPQSRGLSFTFLRGQRIFGPTEAAGLFYVVRSGCVRLTKTLSDGRSVDVGLLGPNTIFTQEDQADGLATGIAAEALVDTTVSVIEHDDLAVMINQSPELAAALVEGMTRRLTGLQMLVEQILARDVTVRLATMLLTLGERFGRPMPGGMLKIALPVPHQLLANMIGSNRVTVTRKLSDLRAAGLTRSLGRNLIAVDPDKLRAYIQAAARPDTTSTPDPEH